MIFLIPEKTSDGQVIDVTVTDIHGSSVLKLNNSTSLSAITNLPIIVPEISMLKKKYLITFISTFVNEETEENQNKETRKQDEIGKVN